MFRWRQLLAVSLVLACCVSLSFAADQDRTQDRMKEQKKDGSCLDNTASVEGWKVIAADQDRTRGQTKEQKKDGSCQS